MKIFITGATGLVGGALARDLVKEHSVLAMCRSSHGEDQVREYGATPIRCHVRENIAAHLHGVDLFIHCAALVRPWAPAQEFMETNLEGTRMMLRSAREAGVGKFIFLSSEAVLADGTDKLDMNEDMLYPAHVPSPYCLSKQLSEVAVLEANQPGFETIAIRPRMVWGPGDRFFLPWLLEAVRTRKLVWIDHGRHDGSTTHTANLVHGIKLAAERGRGGEAYFITDEDPITVRDFVTGLAHSQGLEVRARSVPSWIIRPLSLAMEAAWEHLPLKGAPPISYLTATWLSSDCTIDTSKARNELGYASVVSRAQGLAELAALGRAGKIRRPVP